MLAQLTGGNCDSQHGNLGRTDGTRQGNLTSAMWGDMHQTDLHISEYVQTSQSSLDLNNVHNSIIFAYAQEI